MQRQRLINLIIALFLGVFGVIMAKVYLDQQRRAYLEDAQVKAEKMRANSTPVLVAKDNIARGSAVSPDDFEVSIVPSQYVQPGAVTSLDRIAGMIPVADIAKGEQITINKLSRSRVSGGLAQMTPVGKRAITISVDTVASLGGMVKPGDYVDLIGLIAVPVQTGDNKQAKQLATIPLFQNVKVLAVGRDIGAPVQAVSAEGQGRYAKGQAPQAQTQDKTPLITLALSPQEANMIAFVQEQGKIKLILRSPADAKIEPMQPTSWDTLFKYLFPEALAQKKEEPKEPPAPAVKYVEIYRGLERTKVPLSE